MRTITLHGELANRYGSTHVAEVRSVREALRYFAANFKDFTEYLMTSDKRQMGYEVWDGDYNLEGKDIEFQKQGTGTIEIIPRIIGSGANARIILGAVLVVVGVFTTFFGDYSGSVITLGLSLIAGGIAEKLARNPPEAQDAQNTKSYIFSGPINSTKQGNPIPIGYGRMVVGSQVVSASIVSTSTLAPSEADTLPPIGWELVSEVGTTDHRDYDESGDSEPPNNEGEFSDGGWDNDSLGYA